jgi:hypothetical protein
MDQREGEDPQEVPSAPSMGGVVFETIWSDERGKTSVWNGGMVESPVVSNRPTRKNKELQRFKYLCLGATAAMLVAAVGVGVLLILFTESTQPRTSFSNLADKNATTTGRENGSDPYAVDAKLPTAAPIVFSPPELILVPSPPTPATLAPPFTPSKLLTPTTSVFSNNATWAPTIEQNSTEPKYIVFYAIGNAPLFSGQDLDLEDQLRNLPDDANFVIHLGGILIRNDANDDDAAFGCCNEHDFDTAANALKVSNAPVFVIMGEKEYSSLCPDNGYTAWLSTFRSFESRYWDTLPMRVDRMEGRPENFMFEFKDTLFIGLNLMIGINDEDFDDMRLAGEFMWTRAMVRSYLDRAVFLQSVRTPKVVLFGHSNPTMGDHNGFFDALVQLMDDEFANDVPFLYVTTGHNSWRYDPFFMGRRNFLQIMVTGGVVEAPFRIQINVDADDCVSAFEYERCSYSWRQ